jgi:hypothetical protein
MIYCMTETIMNTALLRRDIEICENMHDIDVVDREAIYLASVAEARLEFALLEAEATLIAVYALRMRAAEKSTEL